MGIEFTAMNLFMLNSDGVVISLGEPNSVEITSGDEWNEPELNAVLKRRDLPEIHGTIRMSKRQHILLWDIACGLSKALYATCPDKRVVYLAQHGRKERTRKKNRARVVKILERMEA